MSPSSDTRLRVTLVGVVDDAPQARAEALAAAVKLVLALVGIEP